MALTPQQWKDDWRNRGQESFLQGATLHSADYTAPSEEWTHDHCEFCWATFSEDPAPDEFPRGYTTSDCRHWICQECFHDLKDIFSWQTE